MLASQPSTRHTLTMMQKIGIEYGIKGARMTESDQSDVVSNQPSGSDAALQTLATLDQKSLAEQVDILTQIHQQLSAELAELDHL